MSLYIYISIKLSVFRNILLWEQGKLKNITQQIKRTNRKISPILTISAKNGWMKQKDRFSRVIAGKELKNYIELHKNELSYNHGNSKYAKYGIIYVQRDYDKALVPKVYHSFMVVDGDPRFIENLSLGHKIDKELSKLITSGARQDGLLNINKNSFYSINLFYPTKKEQELISNLMDKINSLIALYERKVKLLSQIKKYFLQKLFVNGEQKQPEIRFQKFNDDWKEKKLAQLLKVSNETNLDNKLCFSKQHVLSVSDKFGVVNQIKLQGRSFAGNNISKYKVVRNNQIVYTKSPLKDKPYGIIKIVSNVKGIVSPLYIVNNVIDNNAWFIYYYFDLKSRTNNYLKPLVRLGAKHTMNITDKEWLSGKIFISEVIQEQEEIANLLSTIDKLIRLNEQKLDNLEELKKCLLQNMFC